MTTRREAVQLLAGGLLVSQGWAVRAQRPNIDPQPITPYTGPWFPAVPDTTEFGPTKLIVFPTSWRIHSQSDPTRGVIYSDPGNTDRRPVAYVYVDNNARVAVRLGFTRTYWGGGVATFTQVRLYFDIASGIPFSVYCTPGGGMGDGCAGSVTQTFVGPDSIVYPSDSAVSQQDVFSKILQGCVGWSGTADDCGRVL